ncbi:MAG: biotin--[acetyl-CoA-carboxylase] ligase [Dehalococcoidia bacterium]|nr:biotin--[acetyl-CoA-carboxylase] ligase [Dehalococcoidia bacterium]
MASTMDTARREVERSAAEGTVVMAGEQTSGRGRQGRTWLSPEGGLALSIIFRPSLSHLTAIAMIVPLAVVGAVRRATGLETGIKWPNDVLLCGKKLCGVLVESGLRGRQVDYAIAGLGINVNLDPNAWPEIAEIAISLSTALGRPLTVEEVLCPLLEELDRLYLALRAGEPVHTEWQAHLETIGQRVTVRGQGWQEEGVAEGVDPDGSLLLRCDNGTLRRLFSGEVISLRS